MSQNCVLYIRLSKEDGERESIANQRLLLTQYAQKNGFVILREYVDDGYSGTRFDRPAFTEMIRDMEHGGIDLLLLKDLSRLGRNYLETGKYTEDWFPSHGIRCIAVCDGYDSTDSCSDLIPFRNLMNEMYARDISRKIRSALRTRMQNGDFIGARPPYGYCKSEQNHHKLSPDSSKSKIVSDIFQMAANGEKPSHIAKKLNVAAICSPSGGCWTSHGITRIIQNPVYLGDLVQGKTAKISFRQKKQVRTSDFAQITVRDTHLPLTTPELFQKANAYLQERNCNRNNHHTKKT